MTPQPSFPMPPMPPMPAILPPLPAPEVDRPALRELLSAIERDVDQHGWDGPARLYALYQADSPAAHWHSEHLTGEMFGAPVHAGRYAAHQFMPPGILDPDPPASLHKLVELIAYRADEFPPPAIVRNSLRHPGTLGVAALCESHAMLNLTQQERDQMGDVRFADLPESVEGRTAIAVTFDDVGYTLHHQRGGPTAIGDDTGAGGTARGGLGGMMMLWLRLLCSAVVGDVPAPDEVLTRWPRGHSPGLVVPKG